MGIPTRQDLQGEWVKALKTFAHSSGGLHNGMGVHRERIQA